MRVAVYDPDIISRQRLAMLLRSLLGEYDISVFAEPFDDPDELLCEVRQGGYDAVFLEADSSITMVARELRRMQFGGDMVITSADIAFAVDGYELGACGYLLKPYSSERLLTLVERMTDRSRRNCLTILQHRAVVRVPYDDILFIESRNTKCTIHRREGEDCVVYSRLDELERQLNAPRFVRCHQSFLVNMDHVVRVDGHFEMINGAVVSIRQRDHRRIREHYLFYIRSRQGAKEYMTQTK